MDTIQIAENVCAQVPADGMTGEQATDLLFQHAGERADQLGFIVPPVRYDDTLYGADYIRAALREWGEFWTR